MSHKCDGCFWKTDWDGEVDTIYPICERFPTWLHGCFQEAKKECEKPGPCEYYMTREEVKRVVDKFNEIPLN